MSDAQLPGRHAQEAYGLSALVQRGKDVSPPPTTIRPTRTTHDFVCAGLPPFTAEAQLALHLLTPDRMTVPTEINSMHMKA